MRKTHAVVIVGLGVGILAGAASADEPKPAKGSFQNIEVTRFAIKEGVENFSADWLITMTDEMVKQLQETRSFKEVLREGEHPAAADASTLKLAGTVTEFKAGSRAKRYLVGFGAGKTVIKAHVQWVDQANGNVVFEDDVDGKVIIGAIGGESIGATRGLAKEVAKVTKKQFFGK